MRAEEERTEEELLEFIYIWWREKKTLDMEAIAQAKGVRLHSLSAQICRMEKQGYLKEKTGSRELRMTELGRNEGARCVARHEKLAHLLQLACDMDTASAKENAYRMDKMITKSGVQGLEDYMRYGDVHEASLKHNDLGLLYPVGNYPVCMSIYLPEYRSPRVLAEENEWFIDEGRLEVREKGSRFCLKPGKGNVKVWYLYEGSWIMAQERRAEYRIPSEAFRFSFCPGVPVLEGSLLIMAERENQGFKEENCRELNVHLWQ